MSDDRSAPRRGRDHHPGRAPHTDRDELARGEHRRTTRDSRSRSPPRRHGDRHRHRHRHRDDEEGGRRRRRSSGSPPPRPAGIERDGENGHGLGDDVAGPSRSHRHRHKRQQQRPATAAADAARAPAPTRPVLLPFSARPLSKADFDVFGPLYARYLEVQKDRYVADMDEREIKGRWKSFMAKWNEGTLAQAWYDPELFEESRRKWADAWAEARRGPVEGGAASSSRADRGPVVGGGHEHADSRGSRDEDLVSEGGEEGNERREDKDEAEDEDDYGPVLPTSRAGADYGRHGPLIPSLQDLEVQREMHEEDRHERAARLRLERKADRAEQKARLEELVPRAEAGTRERQLEKRREVNAKMKEFRERSPGGGAGGAGAEVDDGELMGGGDSLEELRRLKAATERKKTERELRREEIARAKNAEREEKLKEWREKEERSMVLLKELARQRFG